MNLHIREIVAALSAPGEHVTASTTEQVTSVAQPIKLRDVLEEMDVSKDAVPTNQAAPAVLPKAGQGNDEPTVVQLAVPHARTLRRQSAASDYQPEGIKGQRR